MNRRAFLLGATALTAVTTVPLASAIAVPNPYAMFEIKYSDLNMMVYERLRKLEKGVVPLEHVPSTLSKHRQMIMLHLKKEHGQVRLVIDAFYGKKYGASFIKGSLGYVADEIVLRDDVTCFDTVIKSRHFVAYRLRPHTAYL